MEDVRIVSGPCAMCGAEGYELSVGGPNICPACDCGVTAPYVLQKHIKSLTEERDRLRALVERAKPIAAVARQRAAWPQEHEYIDAWRKDARSERA